MASQRHDIKNSIFYNRQTEVADREGNPLQMGGKK